MNYRTPIVHGGNQHLPIPENEELIVEAIPVSAAENNIITKNEDGLMATGATPESVLALINDCEGSPMTPGVSLPTCEQMDNAIQDGIENAPGSNSYIKVVGGKLVVDAAAVIDTLKTCGGASHSAANPIPTCTEMNTAIAEAIQNIPADKFLEAASLSPDGKTLTLTMSDNTTVVVSLADLIPVQGGNTVSGDGTVATPLEVKRAPNGHLTSSAAGLTVDAASVVGTLKNCAGQPHTAANAIPTCTEMNQAIEDALSAPCLVNVITTSGARTIALADAGALLLGSANTLTISNTIQYPVGFRLDIKGAATVAAASGQTIQSMDDAKKVVANGGASLVKVAASVWWLVGALEA